MSAVAVLLIVVVAFGAGCGPPKWRELTDRERRNTPGHTLLCAEIRSEGLPSYNIELGRENNWNPFTIQNPIKAERLFADRMGDIVAKWCPDQLLDPDFRMYLEDQGVEIPDPSQPTFSWVELVVAGATSLVVGAAGVLVGALVGARVTRRSAKIAFSQALSADLDPDPSGDGDHDGMGEAAWVPDPLKRHRLRWWDGQEWTDHVQD